MKKIEEIEFHDSSVELISYSPGEKKIIIELELVHQEGEKNYSLRIEFMGVNVSKYPENPLSIEEVYDFDLDKSIKKAKFVFLYGFRGPSSELEFTFESLLIENIEPRY